jgi:hypothetical protein
MKSSNVVVPSVLAMLLVLVLWKPATTQQFAAESLGGLNGLLPISSYFNKSDDVNLNAGTDLVVFNNTTPNHLVVTFFECNAVFPLVPAPTELPLVKRVGVTDTVMRTADLDGCGGIAGAGPYLAGSAYGMVFPPGSKVVIPNATGDLVKVAYHATGYFRGP